ncbi:MAG: serine hydrolase domain-containing protein [Methyloceanibacter sp.]|uniref:serine hydrolase domain-containing protein n=1 Tax=Methyloceanibacter sp. TaxID=1965321 RepID=UPI003EE05438
MTFPFQNFMVESRMRLGLSRSFWLMLALIALLTAAAIGLPRLYRMALLGSGYMAQILCSGIFVSGRDFEDLMTEDLSGPGLEALRLFTPSVDKDAKDVSAAVFGLARQTALYREGLGCTLIAGRSEAALRAEAAGLFPPAAPPDRDAEWPSGARVTAGPWPEGVDGAAAARAIDEIFAEPDPKRPRGTRALVVVYRGRIVAERYADGFDAHMPLIGWSMSKTGTNALVGLRVQDGALALDDTRLMPEWQEQDDPRGAITLNELMRMTSGLAFDESYDDKLSDVSQMLFVHGNTAGFAASKPLVHEPGTVWSYSSGTTSIIAAILRETFADARDYLRFPHDRLFAALGMRTAALPPDASGTFMGTSFLFASARDWARLGLLFVQDGMWRGKRLLPPGWAAYSLRPTPQSPHDDYGAQVWLKLPDSPGHGEPPMPEDAFYMSGYDGQVVAMVPSRDLVVVRLGLTPKGGDWEPARDLAPLVNAFPARAP